MEVKMWKGNRLLCLNPGDKYKFMFGAAKARVIADNKMNISDFYDICKAGYGIDDLSIGEPLRKRLKERYSKGANVKKYLVLDITPECNASGKPFEINFYQAKMILESLNGIQTFIEKDDANKGYEFNKKFVGEKNKRAFK
jgi:hypothetical protein